MYQTNDTQYLVVNHGHKNVQVIRILTLFIIVYDPAFTHRIHMDTDSNFHPLIIGTKLQSASSHSHSQEVAIVIGNTHIPQDLAFRLSIHSDMHAME